MTRYLVHPVDTLFFRDGRPFEQEDEGMADVRSLFPPWPSVVAGAFRAALARAMGWNGRGSWADDPSMKQVLGDGPDDMGELRFGPPALLCRGRDGVFRRLYAVPRHVLLEDGAPFLLDPADAEPLRTDLGDVALPKAREGVKEVEESRLGPSGLTRVLAGEAPAGDQLIEENKLFAHEYRVGLQRDPRTRTAVPGMLYAASHIRLGAATGPADRKTGKVARMHRTLLGLEVESVPAEMQPESHGPLGGFQRPAAFEPCENDWQEAKEPPEPPDDGRYIVYIASPARFADLDWNRPGGSIPGLPGTIRFACTGRPVMIGGWDGRPKPHRGPRALEPYVPTGSVFFLEGADGDELAVRWKDRGQRALGERTNLGFGRFLLGYWPRKEC